MKYGFIGMGNMARAIASGFVENNAAKGEELYAYAPHYDKLKAYADTIGMHACRSAEEAVKAADIVIMAVKPYVVEGVIASLGDALKNKAIVSVVAGYTLEKYAPLLPEGARVQYIMPNTPCSVGEGMLLFEQENTLTEAEHEAVMKAFQTVGQMEILPTHLMGIGMAISGCGPAFAAMMIEALGDAGVKYGLPRAAAYRLASQTLLGTGKMQLDTGMHPGVLKDGVCSPAGTTIRGVEALETCGVRHAFMEAVRAVMEK